MFVQAWHFFTDVHFMTLYVFGAGEVDISSSCIYNYIFCTGFKIPFNIWQVIPERCLPVTGGMITTKILHHRYSRMISQKVTLFWHWVGYLTFICRAFDNGDSTNTTSINHTNNWFVINFTPYNDDIKYLMFSFLLS